MHSTPPLWAHRLLFSFTAVLALGTLAATEPPQVFHCQLKVLDAHGQPLRNVAVESYRGPDAFGTERPLQLESRATTDAQGTIALTTTNRGVQFLVARQPGLSLGWNAWYVNWPGMSTDDGLLEIKLTTPTTLAGTVQDTAGHPVADAAVWVSRAFQPRAGSAGRPPFALLPAQLGRQWLTAHSDAQGRFRIEGLPADATVSLAAAKAGLALQDIPSPVFDNSALPFQAGQTNAVVVLGPAGGVEGQVVREDTGAPLAGARVYLGDPGWFNELEPVLADAQGRFRAPDLVPGEYHLRAVVGTNQFSDWTCEPVSVTVEAGQTNRHVTLTASRGAVLKAILRDQSTGRPVRNGSIWLAREGHQMQYLASEQGIAWLRVPPGDYHFNAMCEQYARATSLITLERGQTNELAVDLEPAARLSGTVLDPAGQPATKVRVFSLPGLFATGEKQTDAQGHFTLYADGTQFGSMGQSPWLLVARDTARDLAATLELEPDATSATLKLEPALTLVAPVTDPAGKALPDAEAQVMLKYENGSSGFGQPVHANAAGQCELKDLPAGRAYSVIVSARGFGREQRELEAPEPSRHRVELEPFRLPVADQRVAGVVVDDEEKPVRGAWVNLSGDKQAHQNSRTDAKGRFSFPQVCAGPLNLSAHLPSAARYGNVNTEAGDTNVVIHLGSQVMRPGGKLAKLAGTVLSPEGNPAPQVSLLVFPRGTERLSDAAGRFRFNYDSDPFGNHQPVTLIARDPAHNLAAALELDPEVTNATVKLEPGLTLAGRVTDAQDHPLTNAEVQLTFHTANMGSNLGKPVRTDAQGRFELKGLPATRRYTLNVSAKGFGREARTLEATDTDTRRLELEPFRLVVADQVLAGVVKDADDKPVARIMVSFYGDKQNHQNTTTDAKGRFHFEHLVPGEVHLSANDYRGNSGSAVAQAGETNVLLQFGVSQSVGGSRTLNRVAGTVTDPDGKPAPQVTLTLFPFHNTEKRSDATGHFKLTYNPGDWNSMQDVPHVLIARDLARNLATALELEAEATNADLKLESGLTVTGRVVNPKGQPIASAQIFVMFQTERFSTSLGSSIAAGRDGQFELKALPPGSRYSLQLSTPGFGPETRAIEPQDNPTHRLDLGAIQLTVADQRLAGVVLNAEDKPVAGAWVSLYGDKQPNTSTHANSKGRFTFTNLSAGEVRLSASSPQGGSANINAEAGDTNVTLVLGISQSYGGSGKTLRLAGTVADAAGQPAPKVRVSLFPFQGTEGQTDPQGRFKLLYNPDAMGGPQDTPHVVIARDFARNLATALEVEPDATNTNLKLEKGFTLAGRITDPNGKPIPGADVTVLFNAGRMGSQLGTAVRVDAEGRFEIKALPPGCRYHLNAMAKGFGQDSENVEPAQADAPRLELPPLQLPLADRPLGGVVLDSDDNPMPSAWVNVYGHRQPSQSTQTDAKGRFFFKQVCAGTIQLSANGQRGGYANLNVEGGDTNVTIRLSVSGMRSAAPQSVSLKGKPLPDLAPLGLAAADAPAGQPILAVLIDAEQRPSRHALKVLSEQAPALKQKKVALLLIQAGAMTDDAFAAWKQDNPLPFPIGRFPAATRAGWGTAPLPRLLLTDPTHRVLADGFPVEELEAKLKALEK